MQQTENKGCFELSVYDDNLTTENIIKGTAKLKKSFPNLTKEFFDVFFDRIKENKFTDKRLMDSINNVIDNCVYPTPTIAQFISFDKRIKIYNYAQIVNMSSHLRSAFDDYKAVKLDCTKEPMYASINDIEAYNLELFRTK